jgi:mRNA-degrading endonuclease RelE of RelBE toxin-antitoxin system
MNFELHLTKSAEKGLTKLRGLAQEAVRGILGLKQNPYLGHQLMGSLLGVRALAFSLKGVAYRAAYIVQEDDKTCLVFMIGPHEGFYEKAAAGQRP